MRCHRLALSSILLLFFAACATQGIQTEDGRHRIYRVHEPLSWNGADALPVVLIFHGGGGNAKQVQEHLKLDETADAHGFLAVYPEGIGKNVFGKQFSTWNGDFCCGDAMEERVDDVAFIDQLLDELARTYPIDEGRIYATGISNGGVMSQKLACELSHRIAAIAPVAGPGIPQSCAPDRPVPVMLIHGTADPQALYEGGEECGGGFGKLIDPMLPGKQESQRFPCDAVVDQQSFWAEANGCEAEYEVTLEQGQASCGEYAECSEGRTVALCTIEGGGHTWPGSSPNCNVERESCANHQEVVGPISPDLDANEEIWAFFQRFSLDSTDQ